MPLKKPVFISLRTKFMALAVLLTLLTSALWGFWAWNRERAFLSQQLRREGEMLVGTMAIPIINALLYEELGIINEGGLLDNFVADIMANNQLRPLYALVVDQTGRVLAHNDLSRYGSVLGDRLTGQALGANSVISTPRIFADQRTVDFAAPLAIAGKRWGCLRVGVSREPLHRELENLALQIALFASLFSAGALVTFHLIGRGLARPLTALARRMEQVDQSALPCATLEFRRDEIGLLQQSFCRMMERLRQSEQERRESVERMLENERLATAGKVVTGVAHEVNNPLAGIQGAIYQIEEKGGEGVKRYTELIDRAIERIRRIVAQLLDLSRAGSVVVDPVGSRELFEELALFAKMALKDRECRLEARDLCPPTVLHLDKDKIHQATLNLVLNAADAAGRGGCVELRAYAFERWYCLGVLDDGPGIADEAKERIFDLFYSTKESGKGSGLGLALCRSIAESHGGLIEVGSEKAQKTSFTLKIPLKDKKEQS